MGLLLHYPILILHIVICLSVVTSTGGDFYLSLTNEDSGCSLYPFKAVPVVCMIGLSGGEQFLLRNIDTDS